MGRPKLRQFGVELEFNLSQDNLFPIVRKIAKANKGKASYENLPQFWSAYPECGGGEVTSPILSSITPLRKASKILRESLRKRAGSLDKARERYLGSNYGFHVHVDVRDLIQGRSWEDRESNASKNGIFFLDLFHVLHNVEDFLHKLQPVYRRAKVWTTPLADYREGILQDLFPFPRSNRFLGMWHDLKDNDREDCDCEALEVLCDNLSKESCFSFNTILEHGSLEFRFGVSNLDPIYTTKWVELCRRVTERAVQSAKKKRIPNPKNLNQFLAWVKPTKALESWIRSRIKKMAKMTSPRDLPF